MDKLDKHDFQKLSNRDRADMYAELKPHEDYFKETPVSKWIHNWKNNILLKLIGDSSKKTILDAGSGEGYLLSKINAEKKYGIELSKIRITRAVKQHPNTNFTIGDIKNLPFEDNSIDLIVCSEVLEHVTDFKFALYEFKRCLKKSGTLILTFPNERVIGFGRLLIRKFPIHEIDHVNWIVPKHIKSILGKKFTSSNVPPIPYPFCLYQVYKFEAKDFL